ncbi:uncharacterized protein DMENIID0001_000070 [Sergentomyia squamirostris]
MRKRLKVCSCHLTSAVKTCMCVCGVKPCEGLSSVSVHKFTRLSGEDTPQHTIQSFDDFLRDFVKHENVPTIISLFDCHSQISLFKIAKFTNLPIASNPKMLLDDMLDLKKRRNDILTVVDLDCASARETLLTLKPFHLAHPIRWILMTKSLSSFELQGIMESLPLRLDSYVILAEVINSTNLSLKHVFKLNPYKQIKHEDYGGWSPSGGISDIRSTRILSRKRSNLQGILLSTGIVLTNNDSKNHLYDQKDRQIDPISKVNYHLTNIVLDKMNATREYKYYKDWGAKNHSKAEFQGYTRDIIDGNLDIASTPMFLFSHRVEHVDFITFTFVTYAAFIFRPPPLSTVANIFYLPFQGFVWISAIVILILSICTGYFTWKKDAQIKASEENFRASDAILTAVSAITQQGTDLMTNTFSGRIILFSLFTFMFFLYSSYTANIVALLQSTTNSISSLKDLLESNLDLAVDDKIYHRQYFSGATEPVRKAIYETRIAPPGKKENFVSLPEGIGKIRQGQYAFHAEAGPAYAMIKDTFFEHEKCGISEIEYFLSAVPWYCVPKRSPYKEIIKVSLFQMKEYGVERREEDKIYAKKPTCSSQTQTFASVRFTDCYMVIIIIITGYITSLVIFMFELIIKKKRIFQHQEKLCLF